MARRVAVACVLALVVAASASAQSGSSGTSTGQSTTATQTQSSSTTTDDTRPATTTFFGDTGLWFVPTGEVLPNITVSIGVGQFQPGEAMGDLIDRCDRALYLAKRAGRNKVVTEDELDRERAAG